jgi:ferredoxin
MGSILTPLLTSLEQSHALPNACTACGRCAEVCPADIPLPDLLRDLRHEEATQKLSPTRWRLGMRAHAWLACQPMLYHALTGLGIFALHLFGRRRGSFRRLPMAAGWTSQRDFPAPQGRTFMHQYAARHREENITAHKMALAAADRASPVPPGSAERQRAVPDKAPRRRSAGGRAPADRIEPSLRADWPRRPDPRKPGNTRHEQAGGDTTTRSKPGAHPGGPRGKKPRRRPDDER